MKLLLKSMRLRIAVFSQNDFKYTPAWKWALCYVTTGTATVLIPLPVIVLHAEASICPRPKKLELTAMASV